MSSLHINNILDKLDELRAVFVLGQRAVPFLEEMFVFLKDISSLLDEINLSIRESTTKMPHASSRLESVSQATELATTEILDVVDTSLSNLGQLKQRLTRSQDHIKAITRADARLIRLLRSALRDHDERLLARVEVIHQEKTTLRRQVAAQVRTDVDTIDAIRSTLNHIMMALQVQDITSQQLAAVNHLIESIQDRMGSLMARMGSGVEPAARTTARRFAAFDPNAQYDRSGTKQRAADAVMASFDPASPPAELAPASQADIDQLFGAQGGPAASGPASQDAIDQLFQGNGAAQPKADRPPAPPSEPASQADIDQLFSAQSNGPASQDDIDKLFQGG